MAPRQNHLHGIWLVIGLVGCGLGGCSSSAGGGGTGGAAVTSSGGSSGGAAVAGGSNGSGGAPASGGSMSAGGKSSAGTPEKGGAPGSGGTPSGGSPGSGGSNSGGSTGTGVTAAGGAAAGGSSGSAMGGMTSARDGGVLPGRGGSPGSDAAEGGKTGSGGTTTAGTSGSAGSTGGGSSGSCQKGQIKPAEVVIMGESFYAIAPQYIQNRIQDDARTAGALASGATYRNVAVSGQNMNYIATTEWTNATQGGASVKNVIMDGGGIDCLTGGGSGGCTTCPDTFKTLLGKMVTAGVQDVIYTRYPEPGSPPGSNASLKACLDATMPNMQTVCQGVTGLRCHWVDLRPVWQTGDVLSDGLHPTQSGGNHVGDLVWSEMVKDCMAQ